MKKLLKYLYRTWRQAGIRRQLHAMDDRMLKDIGLSRDQVRSLRF